MYDTAPDRADNETLILIEVRKLPDVQHSIEDDHRIDWKESVVIDREMNLYRRRVKEALYIRKFPNFNQDQGLIVSPIWSGVIH